MKIYKIDGGDEGCDYGVCSFEEAYKGCKVGEVCEELLNGQTEFSNDELGFGVCVEEPIEENEVRVFLRMRDREDYDALKCEKLFLENEII